MERLSSVVQLASRGGDRKPPWGEEAPGRCTWHFAGTQPCGELPSFAECILWPLLHSSPFALNGCPLGFFLTWTSVHDDVTVLE